MMRISEFAPDVDVAGNLVFDGEFFYQYDAWNRLTQVNEAGGLTAADFGADSSLAAGLHPGPWRLRYVYDGLGRLIQKITPVVPGGNQVRREQYYYDGVRRVQEAVKRQEASTLVSGGQSSGIEEPLESTSLEPMADASIVIGLPAEWDQREYVYGPDYVDEFVATIDEDQRPFWLLQDGNYNVTAVVAGADLPDGSGGIIPAGTILEQYAYSPYGRADRPESASHASDGASDATCAG